MSLPARTVRVLVAALVGALVAFSVVTVPARAATDSKLVLVLDSSGSMKEKVGGHAKISIAKASLRTVIGKLPADAPVGLRVYGATVFDKSQKGACTDSQLVVPIGTDNRSRLRDEIAKYQPYGETPISYALLQAAADLGHDGKRSILLVSDGEETCAANPCAVARKLAKSDITLKIDVVGLAVSGRVRSQLRCIADRGRGTYYDADSREDLEESLDTLATRAFRPFRVTGTPVEGSTKAAKAPTIGPGQYVDRVPADSKRLYYRIPHALPGSTLHVGFTALVKPGNDTFRVGTANLQFFDEKDRLCGWNHLSQGITVVGSTPLVGAEADSWEDSEESDCFTDDLLLSLYTADFQGAQFELVVSEEPPVTSMRSLSVSSGPPRWSPMTGLGASQKVPVPGTSFSDAATLSPGVHRGRILTGENQVFAVPTDWGQRLQVQVEVAPRKGLLAKTLWVGDHLDVQLFGPMRGEYQNLSARGMPDWNTNLGDDAKTYRVGGTTDTVRYGNRTLAGSQHLSDLPGVQYVALGMSRHYTGQRFLIAYTLKVKVLGTAGKGAPEYVPTSSPTPSPTPTPSASGAPTPGPVSPTPAPDHTGGASGVSMTALVVVAVGAVALGVAGTLVVGWRRRRRPTS